MPASKSDPQRLASEDGVSEVIGFITTFSIVAMLLLVSMLAFSDAQERASDRVAEIETESVAQRVAAVAIDLALYTGTGGNATVNVAVELPISIVGDGYQVRLMDAGCEEVTPPCIRVEAAGSFAEQSLFLAAGTAVCQGPQVVSGGTIFVSNNVTASPYCIRLSHRPFP